MIVNRSGQRVAVRRHTHTDGKCRRPSTFPLLATQMRPACESIESWLRADAANVAVVHCKVRPPAVSVAVAPCARFAACP